MKYWYSALVHPTRVFNTKLCQSLNFNLQTHPKQCAAVRRNLSVKMVAPQCLFWSLSFRTEAIYGNSPSRALNPPRILMWTALWCCVLSLRIVWSTNTCPHFVETTAGNVVWNQLHAYFVPNFCKVCKAFQILFYVICDRRRTLTCRILR